MAGHGGELNPSVASREVSAHLFTLMSQEMVLYVKF
jgi:hypothetical protein